MQNEIVGQVKVEVNGKRVPGLGYSTNKKTGTIKINWFGRLLIKLFLLFKPKPQEVTIDYPYLPAKGRVYIGDEYIGDVETVKLTAKEQWPPQPND